MGVSYGRASVRVEPNRRAQHAEDFGDLLRASRRHQGLSQAALGGEKYSGSYISHLESGRRTPTPEVIDFLARRLGVSPLEWGVYGTTTTRGLDVTQRGGDHVVDIMVAQRARFDRDWAAAEAHAVAAATSAAAAGDSLRHWEATYVVAQAKYGSGQFRGAAEVASELAEHEAARDLPMARAQALSLASVAYRACDRLGWAIAFGARAVEAASSTPPIILAEALIALVSALSEAGHTSEEIAAAREPLEEVMPLLASDHSRGVVAWALGTAAFKLGDVETGLDWHHRAQSLLDPKRDLRLWLRFHRAAANCRLDAGLADGVEELLRISSTALEIIGHPLDIVELRQAQARLALMEGEPATAVALVHSIEDDPVLGMSDYSRAVSEQILGDSAKVMGDRTSARAHYTMAACAFEREEHFKHAIEAWRKANELNSETNLDNDLTSFVK